MLINQLRFFLTRWAKKNKKKKKKGFLSWSLFSIATLPGPEVGFLRYMEAVNLSRFSTQTQSTPEELDGEYPLIKANRTECIKERTLTGPVCNTHFNVSIDCEIIDPLTERADMILIHSRGNGIIGRHLIPK